MKTFDEATMYAIVMQLDSKGTRVSNLVHIGNNVFEMDYDDTTFLAGTFGKLQCSFENGKVKILKRKITGMS